MRMKRERKPYSAEENSKLEAFARLEASRKATAASVDYDAERARAMNEKHGICQ